MRPRSTARVSRGIGDRVPCAFIEESVDDNRRELETFAIHFVDKLARLSEPVGLCSGDQHKTNRRRMQQRFRLMQPIDDSVHAFRHRREKIRDRREHALARDPLQLTHHKARPLARELHRDSSRRPLRVGHEGGEFKIWREPGLGGLSPTAWSWLPAKPLQPERIAKPPRRIDGNNGGIEIRRRTRKSERSRDGSLTNSAGAKQNRNRAFGKQSLQSKSTNTSQDSSPRESALAVNCQ